MNELDVSLKLLISFILGAVIGIEREINEKNLIKGKSVSVVGLRSFALIASIGGIVGILYSQFIALSVLIGGSFLILSLIFYILDTNNTKDTGITTEIAMLFTFIIGVLVATNVIPIQVTIAMTAVVALILSQKRKINDVIGGIKKSELNAFISYAIIAVVILPFLPNESYSISDIPNVKTVLENFGLAADKIANLELFNPFKLWLIVALITGVDLIGYILERTIGSQKGWMIASAAGGFISSTATTQSLAQQSKEVKEVHHLLAAALVANAVSFIQIGILISAINVAFLVRLLPMLLIMLGVTAAITVFFMISSHSKKKEKLKKKSETEIFSIYPALKFAGIYLLITVFSKLALEFLGSSGFLITTALGAFAGLDAVMLNTAQLAGKAINFQIAGIAFIIANAVNLIGKSMYSFLQGNREFAVKFSVSMGCVILSSLIGLLFIG